MTTRPVLDDLTGAAPFIVTLKGDGANIRDLEVVRLPPATYVRYVLSDDERALVANGGDILVGVLNGDQAFAPIFVGALVPEIPVDIGQMALLTNTLLGEEPEEEPEAKSGN